LPIPLLPPVTMTTLPSNDMTLCPIHPDQSITPGDGWSRGKRSKWQPVRSNRSGARNRLRGRYRHRHTRETGSGRGSAGRSGICRIRRVPGAARRVHVERCQPTGGPDNRRFRSTSSSDPSLSGIRWCSLRPNRNETFAGSPPTGNSPASRSDPASWNCRRTARSRTRPKDISPHRGPRHLPCKLGSRVNPADDPTP